MLIFVIKMKPHCLSPVAHLICLGRLATCIFFAVGGLVAAEPSTFMVDDGAAPWHDRAGQWSLIAVPEALKGTGPLPQQSCSSRKLVVPGTPASILVGVQDRDVDGFKKTNPSATDAGMMVSISNGKGTLLPYHIMKLENPPAVVAGGSTGGLLLLGLSGEQATATGATATPPVSISGSAPVIPAAPPQAEPATLRPFETGDAQSLHVYLLMGQSNMVGRDTTGLDAQTEDSRIGYIARDGRWWLAREPMHDGGSGIGPGISFARQMIRMSPLVRVGLVPCAVGGSPLKRWEKGGDLYAKALERALAARQAGVLKGILWHQGETDSGNTADAASYQSRLVKMLTDFRADLGRPDLPVAVGQLGDFVTAPQTSTVRAALVSTPEQLTHVAFVDSTGLTDKGDRLHFSAAAAREFGIRYALVMRALQSGMR